MSPINFCSIIRIFLISNGSGFLTGHTHLGLHEVVTAYHLTRCPRRAGKAVVRADGTRAIITSVSRKNDLMRVLVKLHRRVLPVVVRTKLVTGEQVFAVGSNSRGRRHLVVNGHVLIFSPGYIMSKLMVPHGGSGGQLVGVKDGAVIGVPLSQGLGFTSSADGQTLLDFIALARRRDALSLSKLNRAFQN